MQKLQCRTGQISEITQTGILPYLNDQELYKDYMGFCGLPQDFTEVENCYAAINLNKINDKVKNDCIGKSECDLFNLDDMLFPKGTTSSPDYCYNIASLFYFQFECEQPVSGTHGLNEKREQGLTVACIGIFISLLYLTGMYYLGSVAKIDFKAWDVGTVTAGDFTVEY